MTHDTSPVGSSLRAILHATDFSPASDLAFAHALKIALAAKGKLDILHTESQEPRTIDWTAFPSVRGTLAKWGLLEADSRPEAVGERLGVRIRKVDVVDSDPVRGIVTFVEEHPIDLVVLATQGREGLSRWLRGSVAEPVARQTRTPTLFLPHSSGGFVDPETGAVRLRRVLVPIDHDPRPGPAVEWAWRLVQTLGVHDVSLQLLHVGTADAPAVHPAPEMAGRVETLTRGGAVVDTIVEAAHELGAGLIAMATRGRHGILDALRGSTTEQVLRRAERPVLAVPCE
jgi:nucleotide-binding universal stress UspA family protein